MRFWAAGLPVAQPRIKAASVGGHARVYTPSQANAWKAQIVHSWLAGFEGQNPLSGAVSVQLIFHMPRPKSHYGTGRNQRILKGSAPVHHTKKPDIDNLGKAVLDALKGHAWADDSQVCRLEKRKMYVSAVHGMTGCSITIEPIEDI